MKNDTSDAIDKDWQQAFMVEQRLDHAYDSFINALHATPYHGQFFVEHQTYVFHRISLDQNHQVDFTVLQNPHSSRKQDWADASNVSN